MAAICTSWPASSTWKEADIVRMTPTDWRATTRRVTNERPLRNRRSEEHTSELKSLMRNSYAVFCLKNKTPHSWTDLSDVNTTLSKQSNRHDTHKPTTFQQRLPAQPRRSPH